MTIEADRRNIADFWSFSWPIMNVLIGGLSSIDLPETFIRSEEDAEKFILNYGYNPADPDDARVIHRAIIESLHFIERHLMASEWSKGLQPPQEVLLCHDVRKLLFWASDRSQEHTQRRIWSCAILRVMHTIAHIEGVFSYASIDHAREEIWARFQKVVSRDEKGLMWMGLGDAKIELDRIDWKPQKSRESILLKLLHKRANVAENIYDMVGIRIVTKRLCDVLPVVKILYEHNVISYPNAIPSRSRNSLIDLGVFRSKIDTLRGEVMTGKISVDDFAKSLNRIDIPSPEESTGNQHSGQDYGAIQLTCRQLVRAPSPILKFRERVRKLATHSSDENPQSKILKILDEFSASLEDLSILSVKDETAFFPFEVQITDAKTYLKNSTGKASHSRYKKSQHKAARRRILNEILPLQ